MQYAGSSINRRMVLGAALGAPFVRRAVAAATLNAYSIWPENYARPIFAAFQAATGIQVNFLRFSSGEALARIVAEKGNPQVDLLFGGPIETFTAGIGQGVFEPYASPDAATCPPASRSPNGNWTAIADDPLVFMTNTAFLKQHNLQAPTSWNDLLNPAYKNMLQMADARTSGTAVTRIFSILQVYNRNEDAAFAYMKKLRQNVQAVHQERRWRHAANRARSGRRWNLLHRRCAVHAPARLRRADQLPARGHRICCGVHRADQGRTQWRCREETDRLGDQSGHAVALRPGQDQLPARQSTGEGRPVDGGDAERCQDSGDRRHLGRREPPADHRALGVRGAEFLMPP